MDRDKVEIYSELARLLFEKLFGEVLEVSLEDDHKKLGAFLAAWVDLERVLAKLHEPYKQATAHNMPQPLHFVFRDLLKAGVLKYDDIKVIDDLRSLRNKIMHGSVDYKAATSDASIAQVKQITADYRELAKSAG